jgi:hypothetical protein
MTPREQLNDAARFIALYADHSGIYRFLYKHLCPFGRFQNCDAAKLIEWVQLARRKQRGRIQDKEIPDHWDYRSPVVRKQDEIARQYNDEPIAQLAALSVFAAFAPSVSLTSERKRRAQVEQVFRDLLGAEWEETA